RQAAARDPSGRWLGAAGRGPLDRWRRLLVRGAAAGLRGSSPAVRSGGRSAGAGDDRAARGDRSPPAVQPPPRGQRRLVDRVADPRAGGAVPGRSFQRALAVAGAAGAVCGLCRLAAAVAARAGHGGSARLLAPAARRGGAGAGAAGGPSAAGDAELPRVGGAVAAGGEPDLVAGGAVAARGCDAFHDVAGVVPGATVALGGPGGRQRGHADRRAQPSGDGEPHRLLPQHAGAARGPGGSSLLYGVSGSGAGGLVGGARAPRAAVREAGGSAAAGAEPVVHAAVPGVVHV